MSHMLNIANILTEHDTVLQSVRNDAKLLQNLEIFTNKVIECYNLDGKILLCGNGGSASDAQHIAAEWQGRYLLDRRPLHAEALHANTGNSPNIVAALSQGRKNGMYCIGMTGNKNDTKMSEFCDLLIAVPSSVTARIQEMHILIGHIVCELSEQKLFGESIS